MLRRVTVSIGAGASSHPDPRVGAIEAAQAARAELGGARADLAMVFAAGHHLAAPEATLEGVAEALDPAALVGCGAGGILARGHEIEEGTAVAVWAAALGDGAAEPFRLTAVEAAEGAALEGMPDLADAAALVLIPDPRTCPTEPLLAHLGATWPGLPVVGGWPAR